MTNKINIGNATLYLGDCLEILPTLPRLGAVITDPPYSERTHSGQCVGEQKDGVWRDPLGYSAWGLDDVRRFTTKAVAACDGWIVAMCDDVLAPAYGEALRAAGRYVFAPLPYFAPGSRVRLSGDGPSSWTIWIVVARTTEQHKWGTLPGGYVRELGWDAPEKMGGKPVKLMEHLIRDYSTPDMVVCDPCMGRGSTAIAALSMGRPFIGIERDPVEFEQACLRIENEQRQQRLIP